MKSRRTSPVPITTARARLFDLVDDVLTGRTDRVELSHRGYSENVVLIRKSEIEGLEADLQALRAAGAPEPQPLRGSAALRGDPEKVLERSRDEQRRLVAEKRASMRGGRQGRA